MLSVQSKSLSKLKNIIVSNKKLKEYIVNRSPQQDRVCIHDPDSDEVMVTFSDSEKVFIRDFFKKSMADEININQNGRFDIVFIE